MNPDRHTHTHKDCLQTFKVLYTYTHIKRRGINRGLHTKVYKHTHSHTHKIKRPHHSTRVLENAGWLNNKNNPSMSSNTSCASPVLPTTRDKMSAGRPERLDETAVRPGIGIRTAGRGVRDAEG